MSILVFITNNKGKLAEVQDLASKHDFKVVSPQELGLKFDHEETGETFEANARQKLASIIDDIDEPEYWVAADDSGIMIDALNGEPGVKTRRWIGREMTDQEIIDYTLKQMENIPYAKRGAVATSVVALAQASNPNAVITFTGEARGTILIKPNAAVKSQHLPFRQLFFVPESGLMLGQTDGLSENQKKYFKTHRQKAFEKIFKYIEDLKSLTS